MACSSSVGVYLAGVGGLRETSLGFPEVGFGACMDEVKSLFIATLLFSVMLLGGSSARRRLGSFWVCGMGVCGVGWSIFGRGEVVGVGVGWLCASPGWVSIMSSRGREFGGKIWEPDSCVFMLGREELG